MESMKGAGEDLSARRCNARAVRKRKRAAGPEGPTARWICLDPADAACGTRQGGVVLAVG
jgi:hypothetical protein